MRYTEDDTPVTNFSVATRQAVSKERVGGCPQGWKESLNGKNWELTTWFRVTCWRKLAEAVNQYLEKRSQVFVEGELRGQADDGNQNPRIWTGNDGEHRASYEVTARTVKFLGKREGNGVRPLVSRRPEGRLTICCHFAQAATTNEQSAAGQPPTQKVSLWKTKGSPFFGRPGDQARVRQRTNALSTGTLASRQS